MAHMAPKNYITMGKQENVVKLSYILCIMLLLCRLDASEGSQQLNSHSRQANRHFVAEFRSTSPTNYPTTTSKPLGIDSYVEGRISRSNDTQKSSNPDALQFLESIIMQSVDESRDIDSKELADYEVMEAESHSGERTDATSKKPSAVATTDPSVNAALGVDLELSQDNQVLSKFPLAKIKVNPDLERHKRHARRRCNKGRRGGKCRKSTKRKGQVVYRKPIPALVPLHQRKKLNHLFKKYGIGKPRRPSHKLPQDILNKREKRRSRYRTTAAPRKYHVKKAHLSVDISKTKHKYDPTSRPGTRHRTGTRHRRTRRPFATTMPVSDVELEKDETVYDFGTYPPEIMNARRTNRPRSSSRGRGEKPFSVFRNRIPQPARSVPTDMPQLHPRHGMTESPEMLYLMKAVQEGRPFTLKYGNQPPTVSATRAGYAPVLLRNRSRARPTSSRSRGRSRGSRPTRKTKGWRFSATSKSRTRTVRGTKRP